MLDGHRYTLEELQQDDPFFHALTTHLLNHPSIQHGLPREHAPYALAMKALLLHDKIEIEEEIEKEILLKLEEAHKLGYIEIDSDRHYTFPSPLIRQLWSWHLLPAPGYQLSYPNIFSFIEATVALFTPSHLTEANRRVGDSDRRPPEAQYQVEYYRCVHQLTEGNVGISPEYAAAAGTRAGRIDFFIPSRKWGIELTRDGRKLDEHASRFAADGAYGQWLKTSHMEDYVLLDFWNTMPTKAYSGKQWRYHHNMVLTYDRHKGSRTSTT